MKAIKCPFKLLIISILIVSCVEPFDIQLKISTPILTIDGSIDDQSVDQYISIRKSVPAEVKEVAFNPETNAKVEVIEDNKILTCIEKPDGQYFLPVGFRAKIGSNYQLKIMLRNGKRYQSTVELMKATPKIKDYKVYYNLRTTEKGPGHLVY